jgi:hypothetical protein
VVTQFAAAQVCGMGKKGGDVTIIRLTGQIMGWDEQLKSVQKIGLL